MYAQKAIQIRVQSKKNYPKGHFIYMGVPALVYSCPHIPHTGHSFPPEGPRQGYREPTGHTGPQRLAGQQDDARDGQPCPRTRNPGLSGGGGKAAESRAKPAFCGEGRWQAGVSAGAHAVPWPAVGPPWPQPPAHPRLGLVKHVQLRRGRGRGRRQVRARCVCMTKSVQQVRNSDIHRTETTAHPPTGAAASGTRRVDGKGGG